MNDLATLFVRFRSTGDLAALGTVFDRTASRLLSLALHLCGDPADAEDALQATFLTAIRKAEAFDAERPLEPWLMGILAGEVRNLVRRGAVRRREALGDLPSAASGPDEAVERRELIDQVRRRATELPAEQRQVVLLQLEHGLAPAEIAEVLDVKPGTVRMRLHRAVASLRRWLPASLGALLAGALTSRGVASIRRTVLTEARSLGASASVAAGSLSLGTLLGAAVGLGLLIALVILGFRHDPSASEPVSTATSAAAASPEALAKRGGVPAAKIPERVPVAHIGAAATGAAALCVHVHLFGRDDPVVDARVGLWPTGENAVAVDPWGQVAPAPPIEAHTDAAGVARFDAVPAGEFEVRVEPRKVVRIGERLDPRLVRLVPGTRTELDVPVESGTLVEGVTVDQDGVPVAGAEVFVAWSNQAPLRRPEVWRRAARSDGAGRFSVQLVHAENQVAARAEGWGPSDTHVISRAPTASARARLVLSRRSGALEGNVVDARGAALAGVEVLVATAATGELENRASDGAELTRFAPLAARTDTGGVFALKNLAVEPHLVRVRAAGHTSAELVVPIVAGEVARRTIVLGDAGTVRGVVRDAQGRPVAAAHVDIEPPRVIDPRTSAVTDDQGRFRFDRLAAGETTVRATCFGQGRASRTVSVVAGSTTDLELVLEPRDGIVGRLVDERGAALAGWEIMVHDETWGMSDFRDRPNSYKVLTGLDGSFAFPDLGPHRFRMTARATGDSATEWLPVAAGVEPGSGPMTFVLRLGDDAFAQVSGRLLGPDGAVSPGGRVELWVPSRGAWLRRAAEVDGSGAFACGGIPPGDYQVEASADGLLPRTFEVLRLAAGEHRDLGVVHLGAGARLQVALIDPDGRAWSQTWPESFVQRVGDADWSYLNGTYAGGRHDLVVREPLEPGPVFVQVRDDRMLSWPERVELAAGATASVRLAVHVAEAARVRFALPQAIDSERLRVRATDPLGRVLLDVTKRVQAGETTTLLLLPGRWTLNGESTAGDVYVGVVEVPGEDVVELVRR